jgi:hypothetical protein
MAHQSLSGYICTMQIYYGQCEILTNTVGFLLQYSEWKGYTMLTRTITATVQNLQQHSWERNSEYVKLNV